jgi:exopolysaccharide production protein ExoQ
MKPESFSAAQSPAAVDASAAWPLAGAEPLPVQARGVDRALRWVGNQAERCYLLFILLVMSGAGFKPIPDPGTVSLGENSLTDSIFAPLYGILGILIILRPRAMTRALLAHRWTLALLAVVAASVFWSQAPDVTVRHTIAIVATSAFAWCLVARREPREILTLMVIVLTFTAVLSLYWGVADPAGAILASERPAWRGVFDTKNVLARAMVLNAVLCMLLLLGQERHRWPLWIALALSLAAGAMSRSATGLVVLLTLAVLVRFSATLRLRTTVLVPFIALCILLLVGGVVWLHTHLGQIASDLGKDTTMTGRTELWAVALLFIERHPLLGYGFGGFWRGWVGDSGLYWAAIGWKTPHSHNGFVDLTLDLGLVGLTVCVIALGTAFISAVKRARTARTTEAVAPLILLAFIVLYNLTESTMLKHNTIFWVVYTIAASLACGGGDRVAEGPLVARRRRRM